MKSTTGRSFHGAPSLAGALGTLVFLAPAFARPGNEPPALPDPPVPPGQIAYMRGGNVYLADADGRNEKRIAEEKKFHENRPLVWAPDGGSLLFWDHSRGWWDINAVHIADGSIVNLTGGSAPEESGGGEGNGEAGKGGRAAAFSPGGDRIAFMRDDPNGLFLMQADGKDQRRLTQRGHRDIPPVWSPDGHQIVYVEIHTLDEKHVRPDVRIAGADGRSDKILADNADSPSFTSDGMSIICSALALENYDLFSVSLADRRRTNLSNSAENETRPILSPSGGRIACVVERKAPEPVAIGLFDVNGTNPRTLELPGQDAIEGTLTWSPDGRWLAFSRAKDRDASVWILDTESGQARRIAGDGSTLPAWRPVNSVVEPRHIPASDSVPADNSPAKSPDDPSKPAEEPKSP